jgi:DNA-binding CsgD family transcriptional regulator
MQPFVGRDAELNILVQELDQTRRHEPRVVLIEGEAGVGKTSLIRRFVESCSDITVLRAVGEETERSLPCGVLNQLFSDHTATPGTELARAQQREPLQIGVEFLGALSDLPLSTPLCLLVDDAHWGDPASMQALQFALRRLQRDQILAVFASRPDEGAPLPNGLNGLAALNGRTVKLTGLSLKAAGELVATIVDEPISAASVRRLWEHTGGNPLYLTELAAGIGRDDLARVDRLLPAPESFNRTVRSRLSSCAPATRALVGAAAVLGGPAPVALAGRVGIVETADLPEAVDEAVRRRLLAIAEAVGSPRVAVRFPHPLVRAAVYHGLGFAERNALHGRAATLSAEPMSTLRHLAAATTGFDDALAGRAIRVAEVASREGAWARAAQAYDLAVDLVDDGPTADRWRWLAVEASLAGGDVREAVRLTAGARPGADAVPLGSYVLGWLSLFRGEQAEAERRLRLAWEAEGGEDIHVKVATATQLSHLYMLRSDGALAELWGKRASDADPNHAPSAVAAIGMAIAGRGRQAIEQLDELDVVDVDSSDASKITYPPVAPHASPTGLVPIDKLELMTARGLIKLYGDDLAGARRDLWAVISTSRSAGVFFCLPIALGHLADTQYRAGDWDDALVNAEQALSTALDADQMWAHAFLAAVAAFVWARRGEWAQAELRVHEARGYAASLGDPASLGYALNAAAVLAHSRRDPDAVLEATEPLQPYADLDGMCEPGVLSWRELRAEAHVRLGQLDEAERQLEAIAERAVARQHHSTLAGWERVSALLAAARDEVGAAVEAYERAYAHAGQVEMPFTLALIQLQHGAYLRRAGQRRLAAERLRTSEATMRRLQAAPFVAEAEAELAACGLQPRRRRDFAPPTLTAQELAVSRLIVEGLTNRGIAQRLIVSTKTVEFRLGNVFAKAGVSSRVQLVHWMSKNAASGPVQGNR